jgi:hypothetical protein
MERDHASRLVDRRRPARELVPDMGIGIMDACGTS